jgi:cytoskeletal protein CcmA (bactofilin family)
MPGTKRPQRTAAPSIISADLVVHGTLISTGDIQIDGKVEGDVRSSGLVIGEKALIEGEIVAEDVTVRGRIQGGIRARKVLLCTTSHVEGNILHEAFSVEAGAFFEGNCRHSDNPLADDAARTVTKPAPIAAAPSPVLTPTPVAVTTPAAPAAVPSPASATVMPMTPDTTSVAAPRPAVAFAPLKSGV